MCFSTKTFANEYEEQRDGNPKYVSPKNAYDFVRELFLISQGVRREGRALIWWRSWAFPDTDVPDVGDRNCVGRDKIQTESKCRRTNGHDGPISA